MSKYINIQLVRAVLTSQTALMRSDMHRILALPQRRRHRAEHSHLLPNSNMLVRNHRSRSLVTAVLRTVKHRTPRKCNILSTIYISNSNK